MDFKLLPRTTCPFTTLARGRHTYRPACAPIVSVLTRPADNIEIGRTNVKPEKTQYGIARKTVYHDKWLDQMAINHLSQSVQAATGVRNNKRGYESLVEAAMVVFQNFNLSQQRELVIQSLEKAFPRQILSLIRLLLPQSKFAREFFAIFTTVFFAWLVGPCEVRESELNGRTERNVVHIKKCRFLEESNCVGMCTNLCKTPSQVFIKESLGMPVNMVPNFDDMSCEMIFGQDPPASSDDPAFKQPCYRLCKEKRNHRVKCTG